MRARTGTLAAVLAAGLLASGCMGDNQLAGSVDALFPLTVSRVDILRNEEAFQVSYYANHEADLDLVIRLSVIISDVEITNGVKIPLGDEVDGHARATVLHLAAGEPVRVFGAVRQGDLVIERGGNPGEGTRGHFSLSFFQGDHYGAGRSVQGTFAATAGDAGFLPYVPDAGPTP